MNVAQSCKSVDKERFRRACSFTTDRRDDEKHSDHAWRNPLIMLDKELRVETGDEVEVDSKVSRLGKKGPIYRVDVKVLRQGLCIDACFQEITQKNIYPWLGHVAAANNEEGEGASRPKKLSAPRLAE